MGLFSRRSRQVESGWVEEGDRGGWDVVFPDGQRLVGIASLETAVSLALPSVEAGPKFNPPPKGTRSDWMPEGATDSAQADSGRWLNVGTEVSIVGESGRFVVRWVKGDEVTVFGGTSGHESWRTFRMSDIRRVHSKPKLRGNQAEGSRRFAHQMDDPSIIAHCPFCGSGDVVARSDGSTECTFCDRFFSISEQPQYPAMPGSQGPQIGEQVPEEDPLSAAPTFVAPEPELQQPDLQQQTPDSQPPAGDKQPNPFAKGSALRTAEGALLDEDNYALHLALRHGDRSSILNRRSR